MKCYFEKYFPTETTLLGTGGASPFVSLPAGPGKTRKPDGYALLPAEQTDLTLAGFTG